MLDEELRFRLEFASLLFHPLAGQIKHSRAPLCLGIEDERTMVALCIVPVVVLWYNRLCESIECPLLAVPVSDSESRAVTGMIGTRRCAIGVIP